MPLLQDIITTHGGSSIAIGAPDRLPLTYDALCALTSQTRAALNGLGIGRNDRVAIVLPNGPEMAAAFIAVSASATAAPLNPAYRADDFRFYLEDLNAKALILGESDDSPARAAAKELGIAILALSADASAPAGR